MKPVTLPIGLAIAALIGGMALAYSCGEKERGEVVDRPRPTSLLSTTEVAELLQTGITRGDLLQRVNSLPLLRIGPGYVLYYLKDGSLRLPLSDNREEQVVEWELSRPDGTKIAEQVVRGNAAPATR